jgi:glucose-6-phosphate 1-dehydrogenase
MNTYAAATFYVDNWRWAGIPFYIRSGKKLARRVTDIAIQFHRAPHRVFHNGFSTNEETEPTLLVLRVQPEEGISMRFLSKRPGSGMSLRPVSMDFKYGASFGLRSPTAYETLLVDALTGDATLYTRQDMVEASWRVVKPILGVWNEATSIPSYEQGSWGPPEADEMLARGGREWRTP